MLWPRIIVAQSGYNLAASGAVGRNAFDEERWRWRCSATSALITPKRWPRGLSDCGTRRP
jgi:ribosome biogenesis GTPase A